MNHPTPDPDVNGILQDLLSGARSILGRQFIGMYLYGSLALGDFDPRTSDIDFVVVTDGDLEQGAALGLQAVHGRLAAGHPHWARELEGSYMPQRALRRYDPADATHLHVYEGRVFPEQHGLHWVIERYVLREHGVVLAGPLPQTLIDPVAASDLRRAVAGLVASWWAPMIADPARLHEPRYLQYAVLTMCRVLYTLEHGTVASKPAAARWARGAVGQRWRGLIDGALAGSPGGGNAVAETRELIRYTCERCKPEG